MIIPNTTLPLMQASRPGKDAGAAQDGTAGNRAAWLREMEKQAMTSWLSHDVQAAAPTTPTAPVIYARVSPSATPDESRAAVSPGAREQLAANGDADAAASSTRDGRAHGPLQSAQDPAVQDNGTSGHTRALDSGAGTAPNEPPKGVEGGLMSDGVRLPALVDPAAATLVAAVMSQLTAPASSDAVQPLKREAGGLNAGQPDSGNSLARTALAFRPGQADVVLMPVARAAQKPSAEANRPGADMAEQLARRPAGPAGAGQAEGGPPTALRIHAVWTERTVKVWIGADLAAGLTGTQLAYAALDIRRLLREQGASLDSLTYNGEIVLATEDSAEPANGAHRPGAAACSIGAPGSRAGRIQP